MAICMFSAGQRFGEILTRKFFLKGQPNAKPSLPFPYCNENIKKLLMCRVIGLIFIYTKLKVKHLLSLGNVSEVSFWLQR